MSNIKYIFRDFWWVVANLDLKKDSHVTKIAEAYAMEKNELWKYIEKPFESFRNGKISEKKFWETVSKNIWVRTPLATKKVFHICPSTYAVLNTNIINLIKRLKKLGYISILLSDISLPVKEHTAKLWRYDSFEHIILSCDVGLSKFDDVTNWTTKIFEHALKKYKIKGKEALFIDDVEKNCIAAQKAWITTILAEKPTQVIRDVKQILNI